MSRLANQISEALNAFASLDTMPALIGGLALAAHRVVRATRDVDFLVDADDADEAHARLTALGYRAAYRSDDAANYVRGDEGLDLLYARRPLARKLLREAAVRETPMGALRVVGVEGLIGFKLQALCNDPQRGMDLEDIRRLMRANRDTLDLARVREFFVLFEREPLLDALLEHVR